MTLPNLLTLVIARINHRAAPILARTDVGPTFDRLRKAIKLIRSLAVMIEQRLALAVARLSHLPNPREIAYE